MTIAMCYLSPEGVVLGADSTSSRPVVPAPGMVGYHYYNYNQKLFELGENSTVGVLTWGLGGLSRASHRTLLAILSDDLEQNPAADVADVAARWANRFWPVYAAEPPVQAWKALQAKEPFNPDVPSDTGARTKEEEGIFQSLGRDLVVGFCVAGYVMPNRNAKAYEIVFDPSLTNPPAPAAVAGARSWGAPNMINRLIKGADDAFLQSILSSGKWTGNDAELRALRDQHTLAHGVLPIRDAIDFVYACIYSTIKAMKFSNLFQICGGPIEIAVITSDRRFRWVCHKDWTAAVTEGMV